MKQSHPALQLDGVTLHKGDAVILDDSTFTLDPARFLAIIGPNGAGKSSLVKLVLGIEKPSQGRLTVLGHPPGQRAKRVAYVPQLKTFDRSFPATALQLVVSGERQAWPARASTRERNHALQALSDVGAEHLAHRPLARLSGGELQRTYLARALVREPELVVLDEPATGVDFMAEHDLNHLLEAYQRKTHATVVMVTHDLAAARHHATDVLVLNRSVVGFGTPERALSDECLRRAYGHVGHAHGGFASW
jgi:zinc transport system ATP-binding protein